MSTEIYRRYIDIINENSQEAIQLDEGILDKLKPYIQKLAKPLMSKFDPETLEALKQAYQQSGGDRNKFTQIIGITKQDVEPLVQQLGNKKPEMQESLLGTGTSLKSKVMTGFANILPLVGSLDFFAGGPIFTALDNSGYGWAGILFYLLTAILFWGMGNYDFSDLDKKK